jgi:hypothetical protein
MRHFRLHMEIITGLEQRARMFFKRTPPHIRFAKHMAMPFHKKKGGQARNIIGDRVRMCRLGFEPTMTQDQLAGRLASEGIQLDRVAIAKIEGGIRCAFDFEVKALAAALKVDARWLLGIGLGVEKEAARKRRI